MLVWVSWNVIIMIAVSEPSYLMCVVSEHDVKLTSEGSKVAEVNVELEIDPETQESSVDHDCVSKCHSAQDETCRRLVEHWVLERSSPVETASTAGVRTSGPKPSGSLLEHRVLECHDGHRIADCGENNKNWRRVLEPFERGMVLPVCRHARFAGSRLDSRPVIVIKRGVIILRRGALPFSRHGLVAVLPGTCRIWAAVEWRCNGW